MRRRVRARNEPPRRRGARWALAYLVSLLLNLGLVYGIVSYLDAEQPTPERSDQVRLHPYQPPVEPEEEKKEEEPKEEDEKPGRVVEVPDIETEEPEEEKETDKLADERMRVEEEQRSQQVKPPSEQEREGEAEETTKESEVQSEESERSEPSTSPGEDEELARKEKQPADRPESDDGSQPPDSVLRQGEDSEILNPVSTKQDELARLQGVDSKFTTDDHLPDVDERGDSTLLNTNRYKYADFFYQVTEAVRRHWEPGRRYRQRDPTGQAYGVKDRHTILHARLDEDGQVEELKVRRSSELDFMDDEAKRAFREAAPFSNPPDGLVDEDGKIRFDFGFYFEISSDRLRFGWRRR